MLILAICEQPLADGWSRARGLRCFLLSFGTEGGGGGLYCSEAGSNREALCVGVKAGTSVPGLGAEGGTCAFSSGRSNGETLWPVKAFWLIVDEGTWAFSSDSNKWFLFIVFCSPTPKSLLASRAGMKRWFNVNEQFDEECVEQWLLL